MTSTSNFGMLFLPTTATMADSEFGDESEYGPSSVREIIMVGVLMHISQLQLTQDRRRSSRRSARWYPSPPYGYT